jgi:hypothetical protein
MTIADKIIDLVRRRPNLTEAELAEQIFGKDGYQQRVNSTCRRLIKQGEVQRYGRGGSNDPYTYTLK